MTLCLAPVKVLVPLVRIDLGRVGFRAFQNLVTSIAKLEWENTAVKQKQLSRMFARLRINAVTWEAITSQSTRANLVGHQPRLECAVS